GKGWRPYPFQEEAWAAYARGASGLIHVPTGAGKTYAAYIGALAEVLDEVAAGGGGKKEGGGGTGGAPRPSVPRGVGGGGGGPRAGRRVPRRGPAWAGGEGGWGSGARRRAGGCRGTAGWR